MNDEQDYLFDGSGPVDREVEALEKALRPLAYREREHAVATKVRAKASWPVRAAAILALAAAAALMVYHGRGPQAPVAGVSGPSFQVVRETGAPTIGGARLVGSGDLHEGAWLETDSSSRANIRVADIGNVRVSPDSKVRIVRTGEREHRLALDRGRIDAVVNAPPRLFVVDTPSVSAVDLGCAYHLVVRDDGSSLLHVDTGQVSLEGKGREAWVPAGAECVTRKGLGPGTPSWTDSTPAFHAALVAFDWEQGALEPVLREADTPDTLSLWHVLQRVPEADRPKVAQRIEKLAPYVSVPEPILKSLDAAALLTLRKSLSHIW
ncbi:MAG: FecR domain-containing protein [Polyangiaceae bacterium]|nr:FecR domain-containing protein [Polyangiaceae bacterium]